MVAPGQRRGKRGPGMEEGYHNASDTGDSARLVGKTMKKQIEGDEDVKGEGEGEDGGEVRMRKSLSSLP